MIVMRCPIPRFNAKLVFLWLALPLWLAMPWQAGAETGEETLVVARPGPSDPMNVKACVAEALVANEVLSAERLRMDELRGQMKQALSTGLPTLDVVGDWTRSRDPSMALDSTFGGSEGAFLPPDGSS